jgi:HK97 family phage major capsid protein
MANKMGHAEVRLERLGDERSKTYEKIDDIEALAETEERPHNELEVEQLTKLRSRAADLEEEMLAMAGTIEGAQKGIDISRVLRPDDDAGSSASNGGAVHRTFAQFARDQMIVQYPQVAKVATGAEGDVGAVVEAAKERLERTLENTTSSTVAGLIVPTYMTQIADIIDGSRPVVASARDVPLDRGSMIYPKITGRPEVTLQSSEKTEAGTANVDVSANTMTASTYLGATNVSWQAVNWSNPDVLDLYFQLAAEAYARQTEEVACDVLEDDAGVGTVGTASGRLGTAGTESFAQWRAAVAAGFSGIISATNGRQRTNTLYLSLGRFAQLAALGTDQVTQLSPVGSLDLGSMSGSFFGLRVVGSYGFDQDIAIIGDSQALFVGENPGSPVEMRVVEPSIGGFEVGVIGAFAADVFDANRFYPLGPHL